MRVVKVASRKISANSELALDGRIVIIGFADASCAAPIPYSNKTLGAEEGGQSSMYARVLGLVRKVLSAGSTYDCGK